LWRSFAGWALTQQPIFVPELTIEQAAVGDATLVATLVGLMAELAIVVPSLFVLFRLVLRGCLDSGPPAGNDPVLATLASAGAAPGLRGGTAACLMAGVALLLFGGDFANAIGALALNAFCALGTVALLQSSELGGAPPQSSQDLRR
jgi:hypothetical protein